MVETLPPKLLKGAIENHQPYFLFAETKKGECDQEIDDMLEVWKAQERLGVFLFGTSINR